MFIKLFRLVFYSSISLVILVPLGLALLAITERDIMFTPPFFKGYLIKIINEKTPGYDIRISSAKVATAFNLSKLTIEISGIEIKGLTEATSVFFDKASVEFDYLSVLTGDVTDLSITVNNLPIEIVRKENNQFKVKLDGFNLSRKNIGDILPVDGLSNLKFLQIQNPRLTVFDESSNIRIQPSVDKIDINFLDHEINLEFEAILSQGLNKDSTVKFQARFMSTSALTEVEAEIYDFLPAHFYKGKKSQLAFLNKIDANISGSLRLELGSDGMVQNYSGSVLTKNILFEKELLSAKEIKLKELSLDFISSADLLKVNLLNINVDSTAFVSSGSGELMMTDVVGVKLFLSKFGLKGLLNSGADLNLVQTTFDFNFDLNKNKLYLNHGFAYYGYSKLIGEGRITFDNNGHETDQVRLEMIDVNPAYFQEVNFITNKNVNTNLLSFYEVENLNIRLDIFRAKSSSFIYEGNATFSEASFKPSNPISETFSIVNGDIDFSTNSVTVSADSVATSTSSVLDLKLTRPKFEFQDLQKSPTLSIKTDFKGDLKKINSHTIKDVSEVLGLESNLTMIIEQYAKFGVISGAVEAKMLGIDLKRLTKTSLTANIKLTDCLVDLTTNSKPLRLNLISLVSSEQETTLVVSGKFNQKPILGTLTKVNIKDISSTLQVLWEPNLNDLEPYFSEVLRYSGSGEVIVQTDITFPPNRAAIYRFKFDITDVQLSIPSIGFEKKRKEPGDIELGWTESNGTSFAFLSKGYDLSGVAFFDLKQRIQKVDFNRVKLSDYFLGDAKYSTGKIENSLLINGQKYDYEKAPKSQFFSSQKNVKVILDIASIKVREDLALEPFKGSFNYKEAFKGTGVGLLNGGPEVKIKIDLASDRKIFKVFTKNAGDVLLRSKVYSNGYGGEMHFELRQQLGKEYEGDLHIKSLTVIGAPFLAKLISLSSIEGILDLLGTNGMVFDNIKADYALDEDFLYIKSGFATSPSFGITLSGKRETRKKTINYSGVLSPVYSLNGMVKKLPLVGGLIGGNEGEGFFGINYFATGELQDPLLTINPLSIITPGKFRELLN